MKFERPTTRWGATALHLAISGVIFVAIVLLLSLAWYPGPLMDAGGWHGLSIVFWVDMVLGPLLTLIVYNTAKKSLPLDMSLIALVQISALTWGLIQIHGERPVVQLLTEEGLLLVTQSDLDSWNADTAPLSSLTGPTPKLAYLVLPQNPIEIVDLRLKAQLGEGNPLESDTSRYASLATIPPETWAWFVKEHQYSEDNRCLKMPFLGKHAPAGQIVCLSQQKGLIP